MDKDDVLVGLAEVARKTGWNIVVLARWAKAGRIEARKIGKRWHVTVAELDRLIASEGSREIPPPADAAPATEQQP